MANSDWAREPKKKRIRPVSCAKFGKWLKRMEPRWDGIFIQSQWHPLGDGPDPKSK